MTEERDLRPDPGMERRMSTWLTDTDLSAAEANAGLERVLDEFPVTPQARRRFLGRWLDRDEGVGRHVADHDPPPNTNRRTRLMLSATGITAALAILALSISVIDTDSHPPNQTGATHIVAADGSGTFGTIAEAVDAAADGDTVLIRPGTYLEAITIHDDITLAGDGAREDIIVMAPPDGPTIGYGDDADSSETYAVLLDGSEATIRDLTFTGPATALVVDGGGPTLVDLLLRGAGSPERADEPFGLAIAIMGAAEPTIENNRLTGAYHIYALERSKPLIEGNTLVDSEITGYFGDGTVIRGNHLSGVGADLGAWEEGLVLFEGNTLVGSGIFGWYGGGAILRDNHLSGPGAYIRTKGEGVLLIEGNTIEDTDMVAIEDAGGPNAWTIRDNTIQGARMGMTVMPGSESVITGNRISDVLVGISLSETNATVEGNTIDGASTGIAVAGAGAPDVRGNDVEAELFGIDIGARAGGVVEGNTVCGGTTSIKIHETATAAVGGNTTC